MTLCAPGAVAATKEVVMNTASQLSKKITSVFAMHHFRPA